MSQSNSREYFAITKGLDEAFSRQVRFKNEAGMSPLSVVFGAGVSSFKEGENQRSSGKIYVGENSEFIANVSLAAALSLVESDVRVVLLLSSEQYDKISKIKHTFEKSDLMTLVCGETDKPDSYEVIHEAISSLSLENSISDISFLLYESYTADMARPFLAVWEEDTSRLVEALSRRINFFTYFAKYALRLASTTDCPELRIVAITALASFRRVAYLFADTAHKSVSSKFLQIFDLEARSLLTKPVRIIEVAPGAVDTGLYDSVETRRIAAYKSSITGFPFEKEMMEPNKEDFSWPLISCRSLGDISALYLLPMEKLVELRQQLQAENADLLYGGRDLDFWNSFTESRASGLHPEYLYYPNYKWGYLPEPEIGYQPVFLCPPGQYV